MSDRLVAKLAAAQIECEARMKELAGGSVAGELPRAWFAYSSIERKLRPLLAHANDAQRMGDR